MHVFVSLLPLEAAIACQLPLVLQPFSMLAEQQTGSFVIL